jgi:hypothetical protein
VLGIGGCLEVEVESFELSFFPDIKEDSQAGSLVLLLAFGSDLFT